MTQLLRPRGRVQGAEDALLESSGAFERCAQHALAAFHACPSASIDTAAGRAVRLTRPPTAAAAAAAAAQAAAEGGGPPFSAVDVLLVLSDRDAAAGAAGGSVTALALQRHRAEHFPDGWTVE